MSLRETSVYVEQPKFLGKVKSREVLSGWLNEIDFDKIKTILESIRKPAKHWDTNILQKENIHTEYDTSESSDLLLNDAFATYDHKARKMYLNVSEINGFAEEYPKNAEQIKSSLNLHIVNHESTHSIAASDCWGVPSRTGYSQTRGLLNIKGLNFFRAFNEAVTEKIAREVTARYIETDTSGKLSQALFDTGAMYSYEPYVKFLDKFIDLISEKTGVSVETVWEGIINGYVKGDNLFGKGLKQELEELFYEGIVFDIGKIENKDDAEKILNKIDQGDKTGRFMKVVNKLTRKARGE